MLQIRLQADHLSKSYGDRSIFTIDRLTVYAGDHIGVIGANGSGKTTLFNLLSGKIQPDQGQVKRFCPVAYLEQFEQGLETAEAEQLKRFGVSDKVGQGQVSGGEQVRLQLAAIFSEEVPLVLADEPTSNLDARGIELFCSKFSAVDTFLLISHDRAVLDRLCTSILEIRDGKATLFKGNFTDYQHQKEHMLKEQANEYQLYQKEKQKLEQVYRTKVDQAKSMKGGGLSPRELKLRQFIASRKSQEAKQKNLFKAAEAVQSRINHLEVKERPKEDARIAFDFSLTSPPENKVVIRGEKLALGFGQRVLLKNSSFEIPKGSKVALCGENGTGKTTLLRTILSQAPGIYTVPKARFGYFSQNLDQLELHKTVLENVMEQAVQSESAMRGILARMLFSEQDIGKKAEVLSGGERIRLAFCKLLGSESNILLLDEPTNYLDLPSIEIMQRLIREYEGTVLLVSHDKAFVNGLADRLLLIENQRLISFEGNLEAYEKSRQKKKGKDMEQAIVELRLAAVISKLSAKNPKDKELLEQEFQELLRLRKG